MRVLGTEFGWVGEDDRGCSFRRTASVRVSHEPRFSIIPKSRAALRACLLWYLAGLAFILLALAGVVYDAKVTSARASDGKWFFIGGMSVFAMGTLSIGVGALRLAAIEFIPKQLQLMIKKSLEAKLCGMCESELGDEIESDGCVVCPECGAAWRVGDGAGKSAD